MKRLVLQFPQVVFHLVPFRPTYLPQHLILEHAYSMIFDQRSTWETIFYTHTKQHAKLQFCTFWSVHFWIPEWKTKYSVPNDGQHSLNYSALISSHMHFWFISVVPKCSKFAKYLNNLLSFLIFKFTCILFTRHKHTLILPSILCRSTSALAMNKTSVCHFTVCKLYLIAFTFYWPTSAPYRI
jgi:hypothetical protein